MIEAGREVSPPEVPFLVKERQNQMAKADLEKRVAALEAEMPRLRAIAEGKAGPKPAGWKKVVGIFEDDPLFEEAMRLGREYRESTRPKPRRTKKV